MKLDIKFTLEVKENVSKKMLDRNNKRPTLTKELMINYMQTFIWAFDLDQDDLEKLTDFSIQTRKED